MRMLCIFIHRYRWGYIIRGDERGFYEKAKVYTQRGVRLYVVEKEPSMQSSMKERIYVSVKVGDQSLPLRSIFDAAKLFLSALRSLAKLDVTPDVIYAYNQDSENVITAYLAKLLFRAPMIIVYHHINPFSFSKFRDGVKLRRSKGYAILNAIWYSILPHLTAYCASQAEGHLALSQATASDLFRVVGQDGCAVVGNGVDCKKFRVMNIGKKYDAIFLGRLVPQKGIDILLKAWRKVVDAQPEAKLILVGGIEPNYVREYSKMTSDLQLNRSVQFTGFVEDEILVRLLNESRLFVFPSRREGFAQAVAQAMACGLCCILSDIPALREVYGDAAIYFPLDDHEELAKLIVNALQNDELRSELGKKARERALSMPWQKAVDKEITIMQEIVYKKRMI